MDPDIAPLARRLAEENNVEWRRLQGSGSDGRIVERDVLDFLARVMAGEEDVDPTPEPLPDGLQAWTDEAGRPLGPAAPAAAYGGEAGRGDAGRDETGRDESGRDESVDEDDLLLAGDDLLHEPDTADTEPPPAEEDLLLADGADASTGARDRDERLPDLFDDGAAEPRRSEDAPDLFIDDGDEAGLADSDAETFDFGGLPGADVRPSTESDVTLEPEREPTSEAPGDDADALSFGEVEASATSGAGPYAVEADVEDVEATEAVRSGTPADEPALDEPALDEPAGHEPAIEDAARDEAEMSEAGANALDASAVDVSEVDVSEERADELQTDEAAPAAAASRERLETEASPATAISAAVPSASDVQGWPLARTRTVVRRHVDVGGLLSVRRSVALEAGMDDLATVAVLYAAARRAAGRLDVARPGIALPDGAGQVSVIVPGDERLAEVGRAVERASRAPERHERADVDLWVVDLAGVGVDEAVLDSDVAQLVLGRLLSDDSDGSVQATISLVADVPVERGAAFLSRVADLLEEPLRLLA